MYAALQYTKNQGMFFGTFLMNNISNHQREIIRIIDMISKDMDKLCAATVRT